MLYIPDTFLMNVVICIWLGYKVASNSADSCVQSTPKYQTRILNVEHESFASPHQSPRTVEHIIHMYIYIDSKAARRRPGRQARWHWTLRRSMCLVSSAPSNECRSCNQKGSFRYACSVPSSLFLAVWGFHPIPYSVLYLMACCATSFCCHASAYTEWCLCTHTHIDSTTRIPRIFIAEQTMSVCMRKSVWIESNV
jgi:hypothetical protein